MRRTNVFARVLLTMICSLALAWICMNVAPVTAEAMTASSVKIIGYNFSDGNIEAFDNFGADSSLMGEKVTFQDGTLTLQNVTISGYPSSTFYGIQAYGDLTVELIGDNYIQGLFDVSVRVDDGSLTIKGPGSLTVYEDRTNYAMMASSITVRDGATVENKSPNAPIMPLGTLLIDNATLIARSNNIYAIDAEEVVATGDVVVRSGDNEDDATDIQDAVDPATGVVNEDAWRKRYVYIRSTVKQEEAAESKGSAPAPGEPCNHDYVWETYKAATATTDGIMRYRCKYCGEVEYSVPTAAYYVFNKETQESIRKAAQGATVTVSTPVFISFHEMVKDALVARPDVSLVVHYKNAGRSYVMSIPAGSGDQLTTLFGDSQYAGFLYLGGVFVTVEK